MTLTSAVLAALTEPEDLEPLRALLARGAVRPEQIGQNLIARVVAYALTLTTHPTHEDGDRLALTLPPTLALALLGGADRDDLLAVVCEPIVNPGQGRSAGWSEAALRLAAWADSHVQEPT